jgi:DNA-binding transcriptional ArsR family regulator
MPGTPKMARENARAMVQDSFEEIVEETGIVLPLWFWQLVGILLLAAFLVCLLYIFRGVRIGRMHVPGRKKKVVRKSYLFSELRRLFTTLYERLRFEVHYRRARRTPEGLLVYADRVGRRIRYKENGKKGTLGRRKEESPGEYMRRLASWVERKGEPGGDTVESGQAGTKKRETAAESGEALRALAAVLDTVFYRGEKIRFTKEECTRYENALQNLGGMVKS